MFKFLVILILIGYTFYKLTSFVFSGMFRGFNQGQFGQNRSGRRPSGGNVNVDRKSDSAAKQRKSFDGGEYIDYEEVK